MSIDHSTETKTLPIRTDNLTRRLHATAWGLFFVWIGVAVLANLGWSWTLVGLGLIMLGEQMARTRFDLKINGLWTACGAIFLIGGLWEVFRFDWPLAPLLLILVGLGILWNALLGKGQE